MKSFIETAAIETVPQEAIEALGLAHWKLNYLIELEEFPPFKKIELDPTGKRPLDPVVFDTDVGLKFIEATVDEFWKINDSFNLSDNEDVLLELFTNAFTTNFKVFESQIRRAEIYRAHYCDAESALVAAEVFAATNSENTADNPLLIGVFRCVECNGLIDFDSGVYMDGQSG
jgi:hypothetical protein